MAVTYPNQPGPPAPPLMMIDATCVFDGSFDPRAYPYRNLAISSNRFGRDGVLEILSAVEAFGHWGWVLVTVTSLDNAHITVAYLRRT
jgi:hypothetical protein